MKKELIEKLFKQFENDKIIITKNLMQVMNTIIIQAKDKHGSLTMTINYEKKENENE